MTNPRKPFRLNVGFIVHEEAGASHDFEFDFERVQLGEDLELADFHGAAQIGRTPQGLLVTGDFSAQIGLECVRCLKPFSRGLKWGLTEMYAFDERSVSESGLILPEDAQLDLQPLLREYALLEIPINPVCRPDCRGLCPVCGQDLNQRDCGHRPPPADSPFSELKDLLN
jgi:uncharacterized protein